MSPAEPHTFRANARAWLGDLLLPLVFFILLIYTAVNQGAVSVGVGSMVMAVVIAISGLFTLRPMLRNWLRLDERSIEGSLNGRYFQTYWGEVLAAWTLDHNRSHYLCLGTRSGTLVIPLRFLDSPKIWSAVRAAVPPEALEEKAIQRLPDYKMWSAARGEALDQPLIRIVPDHWLAQVAGWSGVTFFLYSASEAWAGGSLLRVMVFLGLAAVSLLPLLRWGITELTESAVTRYTLFGGRSMVWEDIRSIEMDPIDMVLVLVGENSQLVIPGPGFLGARSRRAVRAVILARAEEHCIPLRRTVWALFKFSRQKGKLL